MHNSLLRRGTIACALAVSTAVGFSYLPTPLPMTSVATAQSADTMPVNYYYVPAADAAAYETEVKTFAAISRLRHVYHNAAYDAKYENYFGASAAVRTAADRAEYNCFLAKARLSLALLKLEGNAEARALDLTKVGLDLETTAAAVAVLEPATVAARNAAWQAEASDPDRAKKSNRHGIFQDGLGRLTAVKTALEAGQPTFEYDAFAVINWETEDRFVQAKLNEHAIPAEIAQQVVVSIAPTDDVDTAAIAQAATANKAYLAGLFGELPSPKPADDPTPPPTLTTSPEETTTPAPKPTDNEPTVSPKPPAPVDLLHPVFAFFLRLAAVLKGWLGSS